MMFELPMSEFTAKKLDYKLSDISEKRRLAETVQQERKKLEEFMVWLYEERISTHEKQFIAEVKEQLKIHYARELSHQDQPITPETDMTSIVPYAEAVKEHAEEIKSKSMETLKNLLQLTENIDQVPIIKLVWEDLTPEVTYDIDSLVKADEMNMFSPAQRETLGMRLFGMEPKEFTAQDKMDIEKRHKEKISLLKKPVPGQPGGGGGLGQKPAKKPKEKKPEKKTEKSDSKKRKSKEKSSSKKEKSKEKSSSSSKKSKK